jgi:hypothetical protein
MFQMLNVLHSWQKKGGQMNDTYRLTKQTTAITVGSRDRTIVCIPAGSSITVIGSAVTDDRFTEVIWGEHRLRIFGVDLKEGGEPIRVRKFNAAGREIYSGA